MTKDKPFPKPEDFRKAAERKLNFQTIPLHKMSEADIAALIRESRVHEAELEMQTEALRAAQAELERQRSKYADLFDSAPVAYFVLDEEGQITEVNRAGASMLQEAGRVLIGRPFVHYVSDSDKEAFRQHRRVVCETGKPHECVVRFGQADTHQRIVRLRSRSLTDASGDDTCTFCRTALIDITEQRLAVESLREQEEQLRLAIEGGDLGTWDLALLTDRARWNERLYELLGRDRAGPPITGQTFFEYIHGDDVSRVQKHVEQTLASGKEFKDEFRIVRADGQVRWLAASGRVYRDDAGRPIRMSGVNYDITDRKETEEALRRSEQRLRLALDAAYLISFEWDIQRNEVRRFASSEPALGPTQQDKPATFEDVLEVVHPDDRNLFTANVDAALQREDGEYESEFRIVRANGQIAWLYERGRVERDAEGHPTRLIGLSQDITKRKESEKALRAARDEFEQRVEQRTADLQRTADVLREEVRAKIEAQKALECQNEILQMIIDSIPVMLCFFNADGDVALINEEFRKVLGYSLEDFQNGDVMELCYPDPDYRRQVWEFMLAANEDWCEFKVQKKVGGKITSTWTNIRLSDGSYIGIGIDIRQRRRLERRIRQSEERYRTLIELSPDGIGVEQDSTIQFVNSTACRLLGVGSAGDLVGKPILDYIHPDYRRRARKQLEYLRRRRKPLRVAEACVICRDGSTLDVELSGMPIAFDNKPATQIIMRDITARKEAESRLRDNVVQMRQQAELLDLAHDMILVHDMEGRITFWNRGAERGYGWTKEEAQGQIIHKLLQTRFPLDLVSITASLLEEGRWNGELTHTTRLGQMLVVSSRWALQRNENGVPVGVLEIDRDITEHKQMEQDATEARRFAESIIETVQEALVVLDADLTVLSANRMFYEIFKVAPKETEGRLIYEIGNRQWDLPALRTLLQEILPKNTSFEDFEVEHDFERIGQRIMRLNGRRVYSDTRKTEMILLAIKDITVRKRQEQQLIKNQEELAGLTEQLLLTEERERRRIAGALHDSVGQSLAFSKRELGGLRKDLPASLLERLDKAKEQVETAIQQTRSLTFELSPSTLYTFGLEAALEELAEQYSKQEGFRCRFETQDGDKRLSEQVRVLLYRATRELLINAAKHAAADNVSIRLQRIGEDVRIEVEDDGKGFDVSELEPVQGKRLGFGLFSIRERLARTKGSLDIQSIPGNGTKVTLQAPLQTTEKDDPRSGPS
jgi:PAS domain S-box-containing protein